MTQELDVSPKHLAIINNILQEYLPADAGVFAFGSRIKGIAKPFSDLDLVIDMGSVMPLSLLAKLDFAFEESNLPYKVDIVDWYSISEDFKKIIDANKVRIYFAK